MPKGALERANDYAARASERGDRAILAQGQMAQQGGGQIAKLIQQAQMNQAHMRQEELRVAEYQSRVQMRMAELDLRERSAMVRQLESEADQRNSDRTYKLGADRLLMDMKDRAHGQKIDTRREDRLEEQGGSGSGSRSRGPAMTLDELPIDDLADGLRFYENETADEKMVREDKAKAYRQRTGRAATPKGIKLNRSQMMGAAQMAGEMAEREGISGEKAMYKVMKALNGLGDDEESKLIRKALGVN